MKWDASARGRLGYLVTPSLLIYGTGGIAWQSMTESATCQNGLADAVCPVLAGNPFSTVTSSSVRTGWTVGGGIDARVYGNWMCAASTATRISAPGITPLPWEPVGRRLRPRSAPTKITTQIGLVGVVYKFGGPVVARY